MSEIDLQQRFPDLEPISSAPSLGTVNGIGLMMYGKRDLDAETGTYVMTHCFTFLFIPILAIGAYRVAPAPGGGWYFVGKVPLSGFASGWNWLLTSAILAAVGTGIWSATFNSEDAVAQRAIDAALDVAEEGDLDEAARQLRLVATGTSKKRGAAENALRELLADAVANGDPEEAKATLNVIVEMQLNGQIRWQDEVHERGVELARRRAEDDPDFALSVLDAVADVAPEEPPAEVAALRRELLERLVERNPDDVDIAVALASLIDEDETLDVDERVAACEKLLEPHADSLGTTDGARILGRIRVAQDRFEEAFALLDPYCSAHLTKLHDAETKLENAQQGLLQRLIGRAQRGDMPISVQVEMNGVDDDAKQQAFFKWYAEELEKDSAILSARREFLRAAPVVPVALDLGLVLLRRGRSAADPETRRAELERAEKTFLAVQGVAGDAPSYRRQLAQVYYWLGKQDEGHTVFDELLTEAGRDVETLIGVGAAYRELGDFERARTLFEEAHGKATEEEDKYRAAGIRAVTAIDLDDKIEWLHKADPEQNGVRADLAESLGRKAMLEGRDEEAERQFRRALSIYDDMPESSTQLNNSALVLRSLYAAVHRREDLEESTRRIEKAQRLSPSDAILVANVAASQMQLGMAELIDGAIDPSASPFASHIGGLSFLFDDAAGAEAIRERVRSQANVKRSLGNWEKAILLAPNRGDNYESLVAYHRFLDDEAGLRSVLERLDGVKLDTAADAKRTTDFRERRDEPKHRDEAREAVARARERLEKARPLGGPSRASAAAVVVAALVNLAEYEEVDADEVVKLAEEGVGASESLGSRRVLVNAHVFRAHDALMHGNAAYAAFVGKSDRSLANEHLLALAAVHDEALRPVVLANADVQQVLALQAELAGRDPNEHRTFAWALLSVSDPDAAKSVGEHLLADTVARVENQLTAITDPLNPPISEYWFLRIEGRDAEATALLARAAKSGIPLPKGILGN